MGRGIIRGIQAREPHRYITFQASQGITFLESVASLLHIPVNINNWRHLRGVAPILSTKAIAEYWISLSYYRPWIAKIRPVGAGNVAHTLHTGEL